MERSNVVILNVAPIPVSEAIDRHVTNMVYDLGKERVIDELKRVLLDLEAKKDGDVCQAS
jgi:hypothetical protein